MWKRTGFGQRVIYRLCVVDKTTWQLGSSIVQWSKGVIDA